MSISGQANINIGNINSPIGSDTLYNAFHTIQNNFTTVFTAGSDAGNIFGANGIAVTQIPNGASTDYKIENTGVTQLIAGDNITISNVAGGVGSTGTLVISATGGNGGGAGVTSVGVQSASNTRLVVTNSPIVSSGNIGIDLASVSGVSGNYVNPNLTIDGYGRVTAISNGSSSGVTSVALSGGNGISIAGGPITSSGTITVTNTGVTGLVAGDGIDVSSSNGVVTITNTGGGGGGNGGGGTVTRVGVLSGSNNITVSGSPITTSGNITLNLASNISITSLSANAVITSTSNNTVPQMSTTFHGNSASIGSWFSGKRSRGSSSIPTPTVQGDNLTRVQGYAYTSYGQYQRAGAVVISASDPVISSASSYVPSHVTLEAIGEGNIVYPLTIGDTGNTRVPGTIYNTIYSDTQKVNTNLSSRARGNIESPQPVQAGDSLYRLQFFGYTGNGIANVWSVPNYSYGGGIDSSVVEVPSAPGEWISSNINIKTVSTSNTLITSTFTNTGNLEIEGTFIGNGFSGNGSGLSSISGANVSGAVAYATTANSVAGANVSGAVAYATTANSVAGANVSGAVGSANIAGTVITAAQPNITSVGTLTSVSVTNSVNVGGNVTANNITLTNTLQAGNVAASAYVAGHLVTTTGVPTTSTSPGYPGQIAYGISGGGAYIYVCIAANVWRRALLTNWT